MQSQECCHDIETLKNHLKSETDAHDLEVFADKYDMEFLKVLVDDWMIFWKFQNDWHFLFFDKNVGNLMPFYSV